MSYSVNFQFFPVDNELEAYVLAGDIARHLAMGLPAEQWIEQHIAALLPYAKHVPLQEFINQERGAGELLSKLCDSWVRNIFQIRFLFWPEHQLLGAVSDTFPGSMPNHILTSSTGVVFQDSTDQAYPYQYWGMYVPLFRQLRACVKSLADDEVVRGTEFSDPDYARRSLLYQKIFAALDIASWLEERPGHYKSFAMCGATNMYQCGRLSTMAKVQLVRLQKEERLLSEGGDCQTM